ncbi:VOC family protein [bacterium]|nr:VOC family protein [bacterium]
MAKTETKTQTAAPVKPIPDGYHTLTPSLVFTDSKKAIDFYKKALGAEHLMSFNCPDTGKVAHAEIKVGDSIFMLSDEMPAMGCTSAQTLKGSPVSMYVYVKDCDAAFKRAVDAGATAVFPLADMFWGDRMGAVTDPFGYKWTLATHKHDYTPEQMAAGQKAFAEQMKAKMAAQGKSCS